MFSLAYASKKKKTHENMSPLIPATIPLLCVRTLPRSIAAIFAVNNLE